MKKINFPILILIALPFFLLLTGCPVSTFCPLAKEGTLSLNTSLIGTWVSADTSAEAKKVTISKQSETAYKLVVDEKGSMFMAESNVFKAWLTKLEDKTFLILQEMNDDGLKETYYVYHIKVENDKITTNDITLKVGGTDAIKSIETYQAEVKASMKLDDFLAGPIVWSRQ